MSLSRAHLHVRRLQSCGILAALSPRGVVDRRGGAGMPPPGVLCRGIFGKVAGSSHSKVLSSPSDGIAQIQGQCTCEGWGYTTSYFNLCSLSPSADPPAKVHRGLPQTSVSSQSLLFLTSRLTVHLQHLSSSTCLCVYLSVCSGLNTFQRWSRTQVSRSNWWEPGQPSSVLRPTQPVSSLLPSPPPLPSHPLLAALQ